MDMKRVPSIVFHQRLTVRLPTAPAQKSAETFASAAERNFTYYSITDVNVPELLALTLRPAFLQTLTAYEIREIPSRSRQVIIWKVATRRLTYCSAR